MNTNQATSVEPAPEKPEPSSVVSNAGFGSVAPRDRLKCWRCKENPRSTRVHGKRGLKCACRGYALTPREWWRMAAIRFRPELLPNTEASNGGNATL